MDNRQFKQMQDAKWEKFKAEQARPKVQLTPVIMDWDIHQWAVAIARCGIGGTQVRHMDKLRREYVEKYRAEPLAVKMVGVQIDGDYALAEEIFRHEELIQYVDLVAESQLAGLT